MNDYRALSRRLERLERTQEPVQEGEKLLADLLEGGFGRLFLQALEAPRRQSLLLGASLCGEDFRQAMQYPPLRALIAAENAEWRRGRGLPPHGSTSALDS